jgi:hypothetical protein
VWVNDSSAAVADTPWAPSRGRMMASASARHRLASAIALSMRSGPVQGQQWLAVLLDYVEGLPANDRRLTLMACGRTPRGVEEFVRVDGQPLTGRFDPSAWLDRYLRWSGCGPTRS